jgi:DNA-binding transcriptional MerR regulator
MEKSPDAFRTISEVADDLDLPQHVLRFWETRFAQIKPLKRGGGRRYYRPDDVDLLRGIRHLLYGEGYTIKGVQRILKEDGPRFVQSIGRGEQSVEPPPEGARREPIEELAASGIAASPNDGDSAFSERDIARLKAALEELLECERVLAALGTSGAADDELPRN